MPTAQKNADHPARAAVTEARRLADEQRRDGHTPDTWMQGVLDKVDRALDEGDEKAVEDFLPAIERSNKLLRKALGEDEPDLGGDVARGIRGFRDIRRRQREALADTLTPDQIGEGLEQYVSNPAGYKAINKVARELHGTPYTKLTAAQKKRVGQLDNITSIFEHPATTTETEAEVWRGVRNPGSFLGALTPGTEFVDDAPTSTSMAQDWAQNFATDWGSDKNVEQNALFKIRVKPGQKLFIPHAVMGDVSKSGGSIAGEHEAMLPPGTRYRVVGRGDDVAVGKKKLPVYEIEVVETPVLPPRAPRKPAKATVEEPGRDLKRADDLSPLDRIRAVDAIDDYVIERDYESSATPGAQDALVELIKRELDLNTRSAKLLLKDINKRRGLA